MALSSVRELVHRLAADAGLREKLSNDPDSVVSAYDLTSEERKAVLSTGARYGFETPSGTVWRTASQDWWAAP